jgi:hypothetical protein
MSNFFELYGQPQKLYAAHGKDFGGDPARMRKYFRQVYSYCDRLPNDADPRLKFLKQNLSRAAGRENAWKIDVDVYDLWMIGEQQNWLCAVTKQPLEFTRGGTTFGGQWCNPMSCTIDRIDSSKGYIKGNVHLVTWKYNRFKNDYSDEDLELLCESTTAFLAKRKGEVQ